MRISETYANRSDLSRFEKLKFTVEEEIAKTVWIRTMYRKFFFLPTWANTFIGFVIWGFGLAFIPILLAELCEEAGKKLCGESYKDGWGAGFYVLGIIVLVWFHPVGFILAGLTFWTVFLLWFWLGIMDDYNRELQREFDEIRWRKLTERTT